MAYIYRRTYKHEAGTMDYQAVVIEQGEIHLPGSVIYTSLDFLESAEGVTELELVEVGKNG